MHPVSYILCGVPRVAEDVAARLKKLDLCGNLAGSVVPVQLIVDAPQGFALGTLEAMGMLSSPLSPLPPLSSPSSLRSLVVTSNPCAEYCEDLWDLHPHVLLTGPGGDLQFIEAIARSSISERYRETPKQTLRLSTAERQILTYLARGWSNKRIGEKLNVQDKTVRNSLTVIYRKLDLDNRVEAALYYWGIQQVLEGLAESGLAAGWG